MLFSFQLIDAVNLPDTVTLGKSYDAGEGSSVGPQGHVISCSEP